MKVKNRLLNYDNAIIYQNNDYFLFSLDAVLLANFVNIRLSDKKIIDLCSGNAPIPMLLSYRTKARIFGVEIQKEIYDMGIESIIENKMDNQIELLNYDVKKISDIYKRESFDIVTCNPPYFKYNGNKMVNENMIKTNARHEVLIGIEDIIKNAYYLLKNGGKFALVHRPDRLIEIIDLLKKYSLEPKRIQFVYPKCNKEANLILIESLKNGNIGLKIENPLIIHENDGEYTKQVKKMFGGDYFVAE